MSGPASSLRLFGLAVSTGLALPLAFSIWRVPWVAWFAVVPLLLALRRASPRQAALLGLVSGLLTDALGVWWLLGSGVSAGAFGILVCIAASKYAVFGWGASLVYRHRPSLGALAVPALWVSLEWLRTNLGWLSIPWGLLGYSQYEVTPMVRVASVAGVYGVSFVLLVANVLLAEICARSTAQGSLDRRSAARRAPATALAVGLAVVLVAVANGAGPVEKSLQRFRVGVVQAGVYQPSVHDVDDRNALFDRYVQLTRKAAAGGRLDLVVWPESSVPVAFPYDQSAVGILFRLAAEIETPLLVAARGRDKMSRTDGETQVANSAFLIGLNQEIEGRYDKVRLLPFDEYVPLREWVRWPGWITRLRHDSTPGTQSKALETAGKRFGVLICFESLFAAEGRRVASQGVDFLVTLTNESFAGTPVSHELLFAMNLFRAAENGLPLVRATTTTISAIVGADGRVLERGKAQDGILVAELPAPASPTLYSRYGDWPLAALAAFSLAAAFADRQRAGSLGISWPAPSRSGSAGSRP